MSALKVMAVFGTRPEAIKMAPLVLALRARPSSFDLRVVVTGQHREMLDQILRAFRIVPDCDLDIMRPGQSLAGITCRGLGGLDSVIGEWQPALVLAQGDTTTTFAASLAAFYHRVDFGHVEAGLRSDNRWEPFPEEMNRRMTSLCATLHFAPTAGARDRLLAEGIPQADVFVTGNTVIDALLMIASRDEPLADTGLDSWIGDRRLILLTAHRRENWGAPMAGICKAVRSILDAIGDAVVVFPMHRNPAVRDTVVPELGDHPRVRLIEPPDYVEFVKLMRRSYIILTDSGGVQEEAPSLGKPVLVLRNTTERPEGVHAGNALLAGTSPERIAALAIELMQRTEMWNQMARAKSPYGDGHASERILSAISGRYNIPE